MQGLVATGHHRGYRVLRLGSTGEDKTATLTSKRCADVAGFNVHANTCARANERERLEILVRYLARPPIADDRLSELPNGRLPLQFKQAWRNGATFVWSPAVVHGGPVDLPRSPFSTMDLPLGTQDSTLLRPRHEHGFIAAAEFTEAAQHG